ncbi:ferric reductase transmembrane protein [Trypanosoma rangeli]|uniref:Ferric reductase transmembrane protein n=1 Tax=Trypanosoma rangeli TaxID=5698 RepID=A0A3R7RSY6_TRYRA|nr:ferric reductase transmembrane protein [Trypanosoma rangeli]RNF12251.1 ferric reductase transmembrane protein [Trypanosoma rangeli]|eukprot:RNF12251.1 ferric reductase transmembrane protein [Trypanosoma rangeli]
MERPQPPAISSAPDEQRPSTHEAQGFTTATYAMEIVPVNVWMRRFASVIVALLFIFVIASSPRTLWTDVFIYHPIFMFIAFFAVVPELIFSIAALQGYLREMRPRSSMLRVHRRCALTFKIVCAVGIVAVEWSKFKRSKMHFVTWHACIGGVCELSQVLETLLGLIIFHGVLDHRLTISQRATLRLVHRHLGAIVIVTGAFSMALGMLSHFAVRTFEILFLRLFFAIFPTVFVIWAYFCSL